MNIQILAVVSGLTNVKSMNRGVLPVPVSILAVLSSD